MLPLTTIGLPLFFLIGTFLLTALMASLRQLRKFLTKEELQQIGKFLCYRRVLFRIFPERSLDIFLFTTISSLNICRLAFAFSSMIAGIQLEWVTVRTDSSFWTWEGLVLTLSLLGFIAVAVLVSDFIPRAWGNRYPKSALRFCSSLGGIFLWLFAPISYLFVRLFRILFKRIDFGRASGPIQHVSEKVIEIIEEASAGPELDPNEKKLIESALVFRNRIAREVMVPRVNVFCLSAETTVSEAADSLSVQGFSRVPVYKGNVDNIIGVLMYRDLMSRYLQGKKDGGDPSILDASVESITKSILYTPETKKISELLQEFRVKQSHVAIVVDEYGGTEGIVTIEDVLEEIVGDIEDEYDEEEQLFSVEPDGWVVDARMSILDIEEQMGLKIPQEGEYDTIGGYIFHRAGAVPTEGLVIHLDDFELEILSSTDRCVEKIRISRAETAETTEEGALKNE